MDQGGSHFANIRTLNRRFGGGVDRFSGGFSGGFGGGVTHRTYFVQGARGLGEGNNQLNYVIKLNEMVGWKQVWSKVEGHPYFRIQGR